MDTQAELWFIKDLPKYAIEKPYKAFKELQAKDDPSNTNLEYEGRQQLIKDVRGQEHFFSLGEQGFTFQNWDNVPSLDWTIEGEITGMYLPAVKNFLAETLQREGSIVIKKMKVFDWRVGTSFFSLLLYFTLAHVVRIADGNCDQVAKCLLPKPSFRHCEGSND